MTQNRIKLEILSQGKLLWFLQGVKITHSDVGQKTLAEQLFDVERAINNDKTMMRCHISCESTEMMDETR